MSLRTLESDGFVDGYVRTWFQGTSRRQLVELVIAFGAPAGANKWLRSSESAGKAQPSYQRSIPITGIGASYGARLYNSQTPLYGELFAFVKGNDFFDIIAVSPTDDLGDTATSQAKAQFAAAPAYTIRPADSFGSRSFAHTIGYLVMPILLTTVILGAVLLSIGRSRRRSVKVKPSS